jgi:hypothetical protein
MGARVDVTGGTPRAVNHAPVVCQGRVGVCDIDSWGREFVCPQPESMPGSPTIAALRDGVEAAVVLEESPRAIRLAGEGD